jgi:hypothetical protein
MKISLNVFFLSLLLSVVPLHAAPTAPAIVVDSTSVVGSGFKSGHEVVIFGAANVPQPFYARLVDYLQVVTVDNSGTFRWEAAEAISPRSVWFAVDLSSTEYAVAYPGGGGSPLARMAIPAVRASNDPQGDALSIDEYTVKVLLVRPDDAVWTGSPMRHGPSDLNRGKPGGMQLDLSQLRSVRGNKHLPGHLVPADFVIMIEPVSLRFYAGRPSAN